MRKHVFSTLAVFLLCSAGNFAGCSPTEEHFRACGRQLSKEETLNLRDAVIHALCCADEDLGEATAAIRGTFRGMCIVRGVDTYERNSVFETAAIYMIAGLGEHATCEIVPTVLEFEKVAAEGVAQRRKTGPIDLRVDPSEKRLDQRLDCFSHVMDEAIDLSLSERDFRLCWDLVEMALQSEFVYVRWVGVCGLADLISAARKAGVNLISEEEMWALFERIKEHEESFLDIPDGQGDFVASSRTSRCIISSVNELADSLDPEGRFHDLHSHVRVLWSGIY